MAIKDKIRNALGKVRHFFKTRFNTYQKVLTSLGLIFGFILAIVLVFGGIAAIPFIGPGSFMPIGLAIALFIFLTAGSFASAGRYLGTAIDTVLTDKEKPNNEKLATLIGSILGLIITIAAFPFCCVGVGIMAVSAPIWLIIMAFIPLTPGALASSSSYVGRFIDYFTGGKTVLDGIYALQDHARYGPSENIPAHLPIHPLPKLKRASSGALHQEEERPAQLKRSYSSVADIHNKLNVLSKKMRHFDDGIEKYLTMPRDPQATHLHWLSSYFDNERGMIRASTYRYLFAHAGSEFEKKVIVFSLLASNDGATLQKQVYEAMKYTSLDAARKELEEAIRTDIKNDSVIKDLLNHSVIASIIKNTNKKKSVDSDEFDRALDILNGISHRIGKRCA